MKRFSTTLLWSLSLIGAALLAFTVRAATTQNVGKVVDAQGAPVADAVVDCYQYPTRATATQLDLQLKQHATSDSKGSFTLPSADGPLIVLARKPGLAAGWKMLNALPGGTDCTIVLAAAAPLAGVVVDEKGQPMGDVEVFAFAAIKDAAEATKFGPDILFGKAARECFSTRTGADGKFRVENFPAGAQAALGAARSGKALRQLEITGINGLPYRSGQEDIRLVLEPAASIEGKLTLKDTGQPIARANLQVQPASGGLSAASFAQSQPIQSDANGGFRIPDLPAGAYRIMATFSGATIPEWVVEPFPVTVTAGQTVRDVNLQANKGALVEVTVVSKGDRKPLADVSVSAYSDGSQSTASTGSNGVAFLRVAPGRFTMSAYKQGWSQMQSQTTVQAGQTNHVRLEISAPFKVSGIIRDSSGTPISGALVSVLPNFGGDNREVKSDSAGRYEVTWQLPPYENMGQQQLFVMARHIERNLAGTHNIDETITNVDLRLERGISVSTRVQDVNGKPIAGATASLMVRSDNGGSSGGAPLRTDEQGRVSFTAMPRDKHYGMWVNATGYGSANNQDVAPETGQTTLEFPAFVLKVANRKLAGKVLGTDGKPVAGVQVYFYGDGQPNGNALTDTNGGFSFSAVCEGPLSVQANQQGLFGNVDAMGGDTNVVVRFGANRGMGGEKTVTITGKVLNPSGVPVAGATLIVTPSFGPYDGDVTSDSKGEFSISWTPQNMGQNARFYLIARDLERNLAVAQEINDRTTTIELKLEQGLTLSGTVQDADGAAIRSARVNVNFMAGSMGGMVDHKVIQVDERGGFSVAALPSGHQYYINVSANGYGSNSRQVRPAESRTNALELPVFKLKLADRLLAGRVVGPDDKPIPGAQVQINGNGQPNGNTRSDSSGHFSFKVCDGPITIFAFQARSGPGPITPGNIQARGGDTNVVVKLGVRQPGNVNAGRAQVTMRSTPLKPQPWTWNTIAGWPGRHKTARTILLGLQLLVLAGTAGGIFWFTRMRGR